MTFDISSYLHRNSSNKKYGICKVCQVEVYWGRDRVLSHKSRSCKGISQAEKLLFKNHKTINEDIESTGFSSSSVTPATKRVMNCFVDKFTVGERDSITKSLCSFVYRTGIAFKVIESQSFKTFIKTIRPVYMDSIPSRKSIAGVNLEREYNSLYGRGKSFLCDAKFYSLCSDGWSNVNRMHLVNFVVLVPNQPAFYYKSISTSGISQTGEEISSRIIEVMQELGVEKCVSVVTDNASNMQSAWVDYLSTNFRKSLKNSIQKSIVMGVEPI